MKLLIITFFTLLLGFSGYKLVAENGDANAQYNLGVMYSYGYGILESDAEAVKWYRLAAEQGNANAQFSLGVMYSNGEGVPQNNTRAYVWFSVAATQGHQYAGGEKDIASEELSPAGREEAQRIATKCFESDYQDCD